jgi:alkylation response protein AidB-like acyl-CoA dehydrogenase
MDADERELFARTLDHLTAARTGAALDAALADLGWSDALADDPRPAVAGLFERQGRANATSSALDDVLAGALGVNTGGPVAVVLPPLGADGPPGTTGGLATAALGRRATALVVAGGEARLVPVADLTVRSVGGLDPALRLAAVDTTAPGDPAGAADWTAAVAAGRVALGHELVGASRAMLALARDHAVERVQFGRPIASFQAVRHRLAEAHVAVEGAAAALDAAWDTPSAATAALAKAAAGRAAVIVTGHAQQVLAGIGFTTDHDFHRHLRRAKVLDQLLGGHRRLTAELGARLLRDRAFPQLLAL